MRSLKLFLAASFFSLAPVHILHAECLKGESVKTELNRLQVGIEINLIGYPNAGRMIQTLDKSAKNIDDRLCFTLSPKPVEIERGKVVEMEIFAVDKSGNRKKINGDNRLKVSVSPLNLFFIDASGRLVISPDPSKASSSTSAFDVGDLQVEFQSDNGGIGFNGLAIKVINSNPAKNRVDSQNTANKIAATGKVAAPSQPEVSASNTKLLDPQVWKQIKNLQGVSSLQGVTSPSVFVFFDPNCPYCAKIWQSQAAGVFFHQLPAVWIPVSYLGGSALGKAAALLRKNNSNVLAGNFVNFNYETKQGGAEAVDPSEAEIAALNKSKALWIKLGGATPLIAYQTRSGDSKILLGTNEEAINEVLKQLTLPAGFKKP